MSKNKLKEVQASVEKHFGTNSLLMLLGDKQVTEITPTGIYSMDKALGIGGLPKGRMIEIFGPESTGKTTLALYAVAEAQKKGEVAAFIDAEHSLDLNMAKQLGVNVDELLISQPDYGEQALELVEHLVRTGEVGIIVVDSVAALTPKAEIDGDMGDAHMGLQARLMSQACRKLVGISNRANTTIIWINQIRSKIGVFFGNPETTTGGNALKFYAAIRLEARKEESLKEGDKIIGHNMKVKVVKNKLAAPHNIAIFPLVYGRGVDVVGDVFDQAVLKKVVTKAGSWYSYGEEKLGQGRNQAIDAVIAKKLLPTLKEKLDEVSQTTATQEQ